MIKLRQILVKDIPEITKSYQRSALLHHPWTYAPDDFTALCQQKNRYIVYLEKTGEIVGTFHISGIIRGNFQSAYLGYEVFSPFERQGYMARGLQLVISEAFNTLKLHRLEANIQPGNIPSINLVARAGFVKEGFSRCYLRPDGREWKDHERWAILNEK